MHGFFFHTNQTINSYGIRTMPDYNKNNPDETPKRRMPKRNSIMIGCSNCGKVFFIQYSRFKRSKKSYCCRKCADEGQQKRIWLVCENCKKPFWRLGCHIKKRSFCSDACSRSFLRGCESPNYRGKTIIGKGGYVWTIMTNGIRMPLHRFIVQGVLGRPLKREEVVHHVNGEKLDNEYSNLMLCSNSYHKWLHEEMSRRYMKEHFANG